MSGASRGPEVLHFPGPAGVLEGLIDWDGEGPPALVAVLCHPHPLFGGTLHNKVVHTLSRSFRAAGAAALRFNFRGVGASAGTHDGGVGETDDAHSAVALVRARWPDAALVLGGFSFGGAVAMRAAAAASPAWLVSVAPAIDRVPLDGFTAPGCPWLIVQGDADDVVSPAGVQRWVAQAPGAPTLRMLAGVGHFFHGRLHELQACLREEWPVALPRIA